MQEHAIEKEGETVDEALQYALDELEAEPEAIAYEVLDEGQSEDEGEDRPARVKAWLKEPEEVEQAQQALLDILKNLELESQLECNFDWESRTVFLNIVSDDAGILIGRQGLTLDALQYLLQLVVNSKDINIVLDVGNYRERHRAHLVAVAEQIAQRVLRQRQRITMKPMDSRDRKIVHEAIKPFPELSSSSVGVEPNRRVVVSLRRADHNNPERGRSRYRHSRHRYQHR